MTREGDSSSRVGFPSCFVLAVVLGVASNNNITRTVPLWVFINGYAISILILFSQDVSLPLSYDQDLLSLYSVSILIGVGFGFVFALALALVFALALESKPLTP